MGGASELVLGGQYWLHGPNVCLIPGKLFRYRSPEESGPALPAAVSTPGPLSGEGRASPPQPSPAQGAGAAPCGPRLRSADLPSWFPHRYYAVYDSGNRQRLLDAYHDGACCSLSIPFTPQNPSRCVPRPGPAQARGFSADVGQHLLSTHTAVTTASCSSLFLRSNLGEYFKDSRNVKKLKDPSKCVTGAKQGGRRERKEPVLGLRAWPLLTSAAPPPRSAAVPAAEAHAAQRCGLPQ